jgi:type II secretory pathway component PulK
VLPGYFELPVEERDEGSMAAAVTDLEGLVNLNRAPLDMIRTLLMNTGSEYEEAETIADCILDWRDVDSERRANGAEDDEYLARPDGYPSKDAPFDSVLELLLVMGMTNEIFYGDSVVAAMRGEEFAGNALYLGISRYVTVYGRGRINVNTADQVVLTCIPGITEEVARIIVSQREDEGKEYDNITEIITLVEQGGEVPESARTLRAELSVYSYYYAVEATGKAGDTETKLEAVVYRYGKNAKILPRVVAWRELS